MENKPRILAMMFSGTLSAQEIWGIEFSQHNQLGNWAAK